MNRSCFLKGMGLGLMVGAAAGTALTASRPAHCRRRLSRWMRTAAGLLDHVERTIGL